MDILTISAVHIDYCLYLPLLLFKQQSSLHYCLYRIRSYRFTAADILYLVLKPFVEEIVLQIGNVNLRLSADLSFLFSLVL